MWKLSVAIDFKTWWVYCCTLLLRSFPSKIIVHDFNWPTVVHHCSHVYMYIYGYHWSRLNYCFYNPSLLSIIKINVWRLSIFIYSKSIYQTMDWYILDPINNIECLDWLLSLIQYIIDVCWTQSEQKCLVDVIEGVCYEPKVPSKTQR